MTQNDRTTLEEQPLVGVRLLNLHPNAAGRRRDHVRECHSCLAAGRRHSSLQGSALLSLAKREDLKQIEDIRLKSEARIWA